MRYFLRAPWLEEVLEICEKVMVKAATEHPERLRLMTVDPDSQPETRVQRLWQPMQQNLFETDLCYLDLYSPPKKSPQSVSDSRTLAKVIPLSN